MTEHAAPPGASARPRRRAPGSIPWSEIRAAYEGSDVPLHLVASAYGIGVTDIYPRAERDGWVLRRRRWALERKARRSTSATPARIDRSDLVERMFKAVERQIEDIELRAADQDGEPDERDARTLGALARTLELLIGMETAEAAAKQNEGRGDIDQLRRELARRIEGLRGG